MRSGRGTLMMPDPCGLRTCPQGRTRRADVRTVSRARSSVFEQSALLERAGTGVERAGSVFAVLLAAAVTLEVPFFPQRSETCGPASLAMVLAFWGEEVTHDELVEAVMMPGDKGVQGSRLIALARDRGFRAVAFEGDLPLVHDYVSREWPLIVALDAGHGRFHDVVVVGFEGDSVLLHDSARGPAQRVRIREFQKKWAHSGCWTLLVLPGENR
jgi:hypothetical protein